MNKIINILHLEDSEYDSELVRSLIEVSEINHNYICIDNEADYIHILENESIDIILSDYNLPDYNGNEALKIAREQYSNIPFIFVSGMMGEDAAIGAMLNGATDYVLKNKMDRLVPAIKRAIKEQELENNRIKSAQILKEKSIQLELQNEKYILLNKELEFQNKEKEKRASELDIANKELIFQNYEKEKRASELAIANNELIFQNGEKEKRAAELAVANIELEFQNKEKEKRAAELIIAKEKAEESDNLKTAFLQNITHEIRTPLNEIIGFSNLLKSDNISKNDSTEFTNMISRSGLRLIEILSNIIEISKIQTKQIKVVKKVLMIDSILFELYSSTKYNNQNKNLQINLNIPKDNVLSLFSDEAKINQILKILINNSVKFTNSGNIDFGYEIQNDFYQFFVKDTGIGISRELHQKIFGKFIQAELSLSRSYEGAGLGLSICKGLVEILGGKIWVESEIGTGSTFYFTIPK